MATVDHRDLSAGIETIATIAWAYAGKSQRKIGIE